MTGSLAGIQPFAGIRLERARTGERPITDRGDAQPKHTVVASAATLGKVATPSQSVTMAPPYRPPLVHGALDNDEEDLAGELVVEADRRVVSATAVA